MINKFFNAAKTGDNLVLSIYGPIGADMFGDGISAQSVSDALKADAKTITVRVNSPGGSAFDGVAIYNLLKSSAKPVNVIVDGMAASAASIIAMAGDTITMATGSTMMIHEAMSMAFGNAEKMTKMADTLTTVTSGIADIYVARTGLPKAEILEMQNVETWLTASEAVAKGFATSVSKDKAVKNEFKLDAFSNIPEELKAEAKVEAVAEPVAELVEETPVVEEPVANEAPDLSLYQRMLELNKRK
jgi:ATP-dependent Clp protease, protease subunit